MNNNDKHNFWADQITKNQHKKHEIHTIIAIKERLHQRLGSDFWNVRPQFQAYFLRTDGKGRKYALVDLYFPFCGIGVEIDEAQHKRTKDADAARTLNITEHFKASQRKVYNEIRIVPYDEQKFEEGVNQVVEEVVKKYNEAKEAKEEPIWDNLDPFAFYADKKEMSVNDEIIFKNKQDMIGVMINKKNYHNNAPGYPKNKYPALAKNGYDFYVFKKMTNMKKEPKIIKMPNMKKEPKIIKMPNIKKELKSISINFRTIFLNLECTLIDSGNPKRGLLTKAKFNV